MTDETKGIAAQMARAKCRSLPEWLRYLASDTHGMLFDAESRVAILSEAALAAADEIEKTKLYVWRNSYDVCYGTANGYAVAGSEDEARELLRSGKVSMYGYEPKEAPGELDIDRPADRAHDLPHAEFAHWEE